MTIFDLDTAPVRELNAALHKLPLAGTNAHQTIRNPNGGHSIA